MCQLFLITLFSERILSKTTFITEKINVMLHKINGALQCPTITTIKQVKRLKFSSLCFKPFTFSDYQKNCELKYSLLSKAKNVSGVYVMKDTSSNRIFHLGSSEKDLYEQVALVVQHYKISSGQTAVALLNVRVPLIEHVMEKIKLTHRLELIDNTFFKIVPLVLEEQPVPVGTVEFFLLYNSSPVGPRPISRIKSNIHHFRDRKGIYVIQISPRGKEAWWIEYVGRATDLHRRIHAHFIKSQAEHRPTSSYYHLRETHDFKIGIIEFPHNEEALIPNVEDHLIKQWDPPGNRYGRGLSKEEITALSSGYKPVNIDVTF